MRLCAMAHAEDSYDVKGQVHGDGEPYTVHGGYMMLAILVLLVGGLVAAAAGMLAGRMLAARLVCVSPSEESTAEHEEGR